MILETLVVGALQVNCYLVGDEVTRRALVIDPGDEAARIQRRLQALELELEMIVLTHSHFDHILAAPELKARTGAPIAIHRDDAPYLRSQPEIFSLFGGGPLPSIEPDVLLADGNTVTVGQLTAQVLATPGHSPGGLSLWFAEHKTVFVGDTLFNEGIGRADLPGANPQQLLRSIREQLFALPEDTRVLPGHGPETSIGHEQRHNPWAASAR